MASLRLLPTSKNYIACFTDTSGRRLQRSTGTHVRKDAQKIAEQYEEASRKLKTEAQIRKVLSDLYEQIGGSKLPSSSIRAFLTGWAERKTAESSASTAKKYRATTSEFIEHLGSRADADITYLVPADLLGFRSALAKLIAGSTVNLKMKILRVALNSAVRAGLIPNNPAMQVESLSRDKGGGSRRAFTVDELQRILVVADTEWRGLVAFGLYTGQRLGDLSLLTWSNLDLVHNEVRLVTRKTGRQMILPLVKPLRPFVDAMTSERGAARPLFPSAFKVVDATGKVGTLSNRFHALLVDAGLVAARSHASKGKGRDAKRVQSEISFHALRHTATSLLKNAGVSDVVAREFVGHDSAAVSKHYTHIETETLRQAAEKMPDLMSLGAFTKK